MILNQGSLRGDEVQGDAHSHVGRNPTVTEDRYKHQRVVPQQPTLRLSAERLRKRAIVELEDARQALLRR